MIHRNNLDDELDFDWYDTKPKPCARCGKMNINYHNWVLNDLKFCSYDCLCKYEKEMIRLSLNGEEEIFNPKPPIPWLKLEKINDELLRKLHYSPNYKFYLILNEDSLNVQWLKTTTSSKQIKKYFNQFKKEFINKYEDNFELGVVVEVYDVEFKEYQPKLSRQIEINQNEFKDYWYKIKNGKIEEW